TPRPVYLFLFPVMRDPLTPTISPYTTLFRSHDAHQRSPTDGNGGTGERGNAEIRQTTHVPSIRLPVWSAQRIPMFPRSRESMGRSEEHTSELQSRVDIVCRLLLEKKNRSETR